MTLNDESGQFLLSFYGNALALGFKGDNDFIRRCYNWAYNHQITNGELHWFYDRGGKLAYILIKSREDVMEGLIRQFRSDIILNHEVKPLKNGFDEEENSILEYDEEKIDKMAKDRAEKFFDERIELENFMSRIPSSIAPVYDTPRLSLKNIQYAQNYA